MTEWLNAFLDLFYPPKCMFCGGLIERSDICACEECLCSQLPEAEEPMPDVQFFEKCTAVFQYKPPVSDAIIRFKFHGMASYADTFGKWLAGSVRDRLEGRYDIISWVPCSKRRVWTRGYDQAKLLAQVLSNELGVEAVQTLKKIRHNPKQSRTNDPAKRKANVLGVYQAVAPDTFRGKRILMVDDVLTTGATLSECGKTLQIAGAEELVCAVVAVAHHDHKK